MEIPAAYEKPAGSEVDFYAIRSPIMHKKKIVELPPTYLAVLSSSEKKVSI